MFNAKKVKDECVRWIRNWFKENGSNDSIAVIGISGGKDSTIAAALCVEALGADRVFGVLMPDGSQNMQDAHKVVEYLGIDATEINIGGITTKFYHALEDLAENPIIGHSSHFHVSKTAEINMPARVRMAMLYFVSQSLPHMAFVVNTCNRSEDYVGYSTKYGDAAGDFSPLKNLLVRELKAVGYELGLPAEFIERIPEDNLCGKTDEENLGFSYEMLDAYIKDGVEPPADIKRKIDILHKNNLFKLKPIPAFISAD